MMALTHDFRDTVRSRAQREPEFRLGLLKEALECIHTGDLETGRALLRNYINATMGFPALSRATQIPSPSLQRMFGPKGNPSAKSLFGVLAALQKEEDVEIRLELRAS